jgi:hypothetical protein
VEDGTFVGVVVFDYETGVLIDYEDQSLLYSEAAPYIDYLPLPDPEFLDAGDEWLTAVRKVCPFGMFMNEAVTIDKGTGSKHNDQEERMEMKRKETKAPRTTLRQTE